MEFFGNFILGMVVSEYLYKNFELSEGEMTKRMVVVSDAKLAEVVKKKRVGINKQTIRLGKPQLGNNKKLEDSIIASTFEALVGAVYLDKGIRRAKKVVLNVLSDELNKTDLDKNYIGLLQETVQKNKMGDISYKQKRLTGPDHKPTYKAVLKINGKIYGQGVGKSKRAAKMKAAKAALKKLKKDK
jgi:ribonuclease-3